MPNVLIPRQHQSAPNSRLPKGFEWQVLHGTKPYKSDDGVVVPSMITDSYLVEGSKGGYCIQATFTISAWKGEGYDDFERKMEKAVNGICHDINVVLEGGDAKGKANILLDKLAERASDKFDIDPEVLKGQLQHRDLQERN